MHKDRSAILACLSGARRIRFGRLSRGRIISLLARTGKLSHFRSSTYHAFLEGEPEHRPNLTIITGAQATRVILEEEAGRLTATGVEYRTGTGKILIAYAGKEVILSAGAIGLPHLLLLSGIGPRPELEGVGVHCLLGQPHVGKHLKDHLDVPLFFPAPGQVCR
jgi:choline dehydrogenase